MATRKTIQDIKIPERTAGRSASTERDSVRARSAAPSKSVDRTQGARVRRSTTTQKEPVIPTPRRVVQKPRIRVVERTKSIGEFPSARVQKKKTSGGIWLIVGIVAIVLLLCYLYGTFFATTTVVISPKEARAAQNTTTVVLAKDPTQNEVPLVVMSLSDTIGDTLLSSGSEEVAERASGKIIVYNNFSTAPQTLVEETRFEAANGKIYKTAKGSSVIIPGMTGTVPGQIELTVYAAEAGAEYNQDLTDFTIPGFKGNQKFEKFYARSVTPLAGGFVGSRAAINDTDLTTKTDELSQRLGDRLRAEAQLQKTDAFIILNDSARIHVGDPTAEAVESNSYQAKVMLPGTYSAILINKDELAENLAYQLLPGYQGEPIAVNNLDSLGFSVALQPDQSLAALDRVAVTLSGTPTFVYTIDEEALKMQLLGAARKDAMAIFNAYPAIASARLIVRPFWNFGLPGDKNDILIRYNLDGK